jgi:cytochrome c oxidase cbb3-type subunit III
MSGSRRQGTMTRVLRAASCAAVAIVLTACDPPGKPGPVPPSSQDITDFAVLYGENCAGCHGAKGRDGAGRILNDPLYLAIVPREELQRTIENGRPGTPMPAFAQSNGGPLVPKQVTALVDGIESNWAKPQQFQGANLPPYAAAGEQGNPDNGKKLYLRACFMCHGKGAAIGPVNDPSFLELSSDQFLRTAIIVGRPDLGMVDYRYLNMGHALSNQDIADLVAYLASSRPAVPAEVQQNAELGAGQIGSGQSGPINKGNEGSGYGPGSPRPQQRNESNKSTGSSSQRGVK